MGISEMVQRRYWVIAWDCYYPSGGFQDIVDTFDDFDEAKKCALGESGDVIQIFDSVEKKILSVDPSIKQES